MVGRIIFVDWITRAMVQSKPEARFVFGDNLERFGLGGQAASMRGEPNAIGVATKRRPGASARDYFTDADDDARAAIDADIDLIASAMAEGRTVFVPFDGLGTGLSELPTRAPDLHRHIVARFRDMAPDCPWQVAP